MKSPFNDSNTTNTTTEIMMNQSADYWFYNIGVNVIPGDTKRKRTYESWTQWQDQSIPPGVHEERKKMVNMVKE